MKLKSLLLGSAAVVALSTGAQAADPTFSLVSLNVCDAYGITGLTIASDDTCLRISGHVDYQYRWGDYGPDAPWAFGGAFGVLDNDGTNDWRSRLETVLRFEATTQTEAGPARATVVLRERQRFARQGGVTVPVPGTPVVTDPLGAAEGSAHGLRIQQAFVSFGDTTVLTAGHNPGSLARLGNDTPYNTFLGSFLSEWNDDNRDEAGVIWNGRVDALRRNGHAIQVITEVADGIRVGAALESLDSNGALRSHGTFVGIVEATGSWGGAHATLLVGDVLGNNAFGTTPWGLHLGGTFNFDNVSVRAAFAIDDLDTWNALLTGQATFDVFTLSAHIDAGRDLAGVDAFGAGIQAGFNATDDLEVIVAARYNDLSIEPSAWQAALGLVYSLSDTLSVNGRIGVRGGGLLVAADDPSPYLGLGLDYAPGGGFTTGGSVEVTSLGGYRLNFNARKSF